MSEVLSTGQAAKLSYLSIQTIIRHCDLGTLKCFKVPGSKFRRIHCKDLYRWMVDNRMPVDALTAAFPHLAPPDVVEERPDGSLVS